MKNTEIIHYIATQGTGYVPIGAKEHKRSKDMLEVLQHVAMGTCILGKGREDLRFLTVGPHSFHDYLSIT